MPSGPSGVPAGPRRSAAPASTADGASRPGAERETSATADPPASQRRAPSPEHAPGSTADPAGGRAEAIGQFIERFAGALHEMGVPRMPARAFVALLTSDTGRLTAAELGAILQASPAAVSGGVRYLIQVGLVSQASEPGSRRLTYSMPDDVWQHLISVRNAAMARWAAILRDGAELLGRGSPAGERIAESSRYFDFVAAELPGVLARWNEYKAGADGQG